MILHPIAFNQAQDGAPVDWGEHTFNVVQHASSPSYGNPATATFATALTAGNLLICMTADRDGNAHAGHTVVDNNSKTWTKALGYDNALGDSGARISGSVWYRKVDASGETDTTPIVTADNTNPNFNAIYLMEVEPLTGGAFDWTLAGSNAQGSGAQGTNLDDTPDMSTASIAADNLFVVAMAVARANASSQINVMVFTPTDDYHFAPTPAPNYFTAGSAIYEAGQSSGVQTSQVASNGALSEGMGFILAFQNGTG